MIPASHQHAWEPHGQDPHGNPIDRCACGLYRLTDLRPSPLDDAINTERCRRLVAERCRPLREFAERAAAGRHVRQDEVQADASAALAAHRAQSEAT